MNEKTPLALNYINQFMESAPTSTTPTNFNGELPRSCLWFTFVWATIYRSADLVMWDWEC